MKSLPLELPWMQQIGRPPERKRIPVVLTVAEVQTLLGHMAGAEALGLRVKDVDFNRRDHSDVSTTMIYTHLLKVAAGGTASPLDALDLGP